MWGGTTEKLTGDSVPALSERYGIPLFLGVASLAQGEVKTFDPYSDVRGSIGYGPLTRRVEDFFAVAGQKAKCIVRVLTPDTAGTNGSVTQTGSGTATVTPGGTPNDAYNILVEVLEGGAKGVAVVRYSLDGGDNWEPKVTVPADGIVTLGTSGATVTMETTGGDLVEGETYAWSTTAPEASTSVITTALDAVLPVYRGKYEMLVVTGNTASAFWTTLGTKVTAEWTAHNPISAICETGDLASATLATDIAALISDADGFSLRQGLIVSGLCYMTDKAGRYQERTAVGCAVGLLAKGKVSDSIGIIKDDFGKITPALELRPTGITEADLVLLDEARYTVPRVYQGYPGIFFNNGNTMAAPGDPFDSIEKVRVAGKIMSLMRVAALRNLHLDADDTSTGSFGGLSGLEYIRAELKRSVQPMFNAGELYKCEVNITSTVDDVFLDNTVRVRIDFSTNPKMKSIELEFDLISPSEFERRNG